jgi:hypothetical protein
MFHVLLNKNHFFATLQQSWHLLINHVKTNNHESQEQQQSQPSPTEDTTTPGDTAQAAAVVPSPP